MNSSKLTSTKSPLVVHSNDFLIRTANDFGINQLKLFFYVIAQIRRDAISIPAITIELDTLISILDLDTEDTGYRWHIKTTLDDLATRLIYVYDGESNLYRMTWFDYIQQDESGKHYTFQLKKSLEPFLLRLTRDFTRYQFAYLLEFKTSYSIRLYDYFQSIAFKETVILSLEEFRRVMSLKRFDGSGNIVSDKYPTYDNLNKKVLQPAIQEINDKSDITVGYVSVKDPGDRRKIYGIKFLIHAKEKPPVYDYVLPSAECSEFINGL